MFSVGGLAVGLLTAFGGLALCLGIANGGLALGKPFPASIAHLRRLFGSFPPNPTGLYLPIISTVAPALIASIFILLLALGRLARHQEQDDSAQI